MTTPLPPELMALMGGGGGPSAPAPDQALGLGDPSAGQSFGPGPGDPSAGGSESDPLILVKQMIDSARQYLDVEPDEQDKANMTKILAQLQRVLAKDQSDSDLAMQGKVSPAYIRKTSGGAA